MEAIHISPYAGAWYPGEPPELTALLDDRFAQSSRRTGAFPFTDALAFVTPHAGPAYSGTVAAAVYRALAHVEPERIVLLAFPHHGGLRGAAVPEVATISTPFGPVAIDTTLGGFVRVAEDRVCDHSFEIQLPFLQRAAPQARVAPLYVGRMTPDERARAADLLAAQWRPGTVILASSDFTHYGRGFGYTPFPPDDDVAGRLHDLDYEVI